MQNIFFLDPRCLNRVIHIFFSSVLLATALAVLAGCGGGLPDSGSTTGSTSATSGTSAPASGSTVDNSILPINPADSLTIALTNAAGASGAAISANSPGTVTATVKDPTGAPVPRALVTFLTDATKATIAPATAVTDAAGVATAQVTGVGVTAANSTLTATAGTPPVTVTQSIGFAVGP